MCLTCWALRASRLPLQPPPPRNRLPNMALLRQRFVNSKDFIGGAIDFLSDGDVDHTETDSGSGWLGAHDVGGIQNRPYDYMIPSREFVFSVEIPDDIYQAGMAKAMEQIGTLYNFGAIV